MSTEQTMTIKEQKLEEEKARAQKFFRQMSGLRLADRNAVKKGKRLDQLQVLNRIVDFAAETFPSPKERAQHALPFLLSDGFGNSGSLSFFLAHSIPKDSLFSVLEQWKLSGTTPAVVKVMDYIAKSNFWNGGTFAREYGELAKKYLPENKRHIVFYKTLENSRYIIPRDGSSPEDGKFWADLAKEYVPQDHWPDAYQAVKQKLLHEVARPNRFGITDVTHTEIENAAELLSAFATNLPLSPRMKVKALCDITDLLEHPRELFPRDEITDGFFFSISRKALLSYKAKKWLLPASLDESVYVGFVDFLNDPENRMPFQEKCDLLTECSKSCLTDAQHAERFTSDLLSMASLALDRSGKIAHHYVSFSDIASHVTHAVQSDSLTDNDREAVMRWVETYSTRLAAQGKLDDDSIYAAFHSVSSILTPSLKLGWIGRLSEDLHLSSDLKEGNKDILPFLDFLKEQFSSAVEKGQSPVSVGPIAAGYVGGNLVLAFSSAVVEGHNDAVFMSKGTLKTETETREDISSMSSLPTVRKIYFAQFNGILSALPVMPS